MAVDTPIVQVRLCNRHEDLLEIELIAGGATVGLVIPCMKSSIPLQEDESSELPRFRQEWLGELRRRRGSQSGNTANGDLHAGAQVLSTLGISSASTKGKAPAPPSVGIPDDTVPGPSNQVIAGGRVAFATVTSASSASPPHVAHPSLTNALTIYRQAVKYETRGEFDEAMVLYRQAFCMNDNVDKAYMREEVIAPIFTSNTEQKHRKNI